MQWASTRRCKESSIFFSKRTSSKISDDRSKASHFRTSPPFRTVCCDAFSSMIFRSKENSHVVKILRCTRSSKLLRLSATRRERLRSLSIHIWAADLRPTRPTSKKAASKHIETCLKHLRLCPLNNSELSPAKMCQDVTSLRFQMLEDQVERQLLKLPTTLQPRTSVTIPNSGHFRS